MRGRLLLAAITPLVLGVGLVGVPAASATSNVACDGLMEGTISANVVAGPGCELANATVDGNVQVKPGGSLFTREGSTVTITGGLNSKNAVIIRLRAAGTIGGNMLLMHTTGFVSILNGEVDGRIVIDHTSEVVVLREEAARKLVLSGNEQRGVIISGDHISGEVNVHGNTPDFTQEASIVIEDLVIGGRLHIVDNTLTSESPVIFLYENSVGGNLTLDDNSLNGPGLTDLLGNEVANSLLCYHNTPPPEIQGFPPEFEASTNSAAHKKGQCSSL